MIYVGEDKRREQFGSVGDIEIVEVRHGEDVIWIKQVEVLSSIDWVVPDGVSSITVCMVGGGKGGQAMGNNTSSTTVYGGTAGGIATNDFTVTEGETISITIGAGGAGGTSSNATVVDGANGQPTVFGSYGTVSGGTSTYSGSGASRSTCKGTFYDGMNNSFAKGGQSGLADGGLGYKVNTPSVAPTQKSNGAVGSGGGGAYIYNNQHDFSISGGRGGDGAVYIDING